MGFFVGICLFHAGVPRRPGRSAGDMREGAGGEGGVRGAHQRCWQGSGEPGPDRDQGEEGFVVDLPQRVRRGDSLGSELRLPLNIHEAPPTPARAVTEAGALHDLNKMTSTPAFKLASLPARAKHEAVVRVLGKLAHGRAPDLTVCNADKQLAGVVAKLKYFARVATGGAAGPGQAKIFFGPDGLEVLLEGAKLKDAKGTLAKDDMAKLLEYTHLLTPQLASETAALTNAKLESKVVGEVSERKKKQPMKSAAAQAAEDEAVREAMKIFS
ncbi:unnamed protein product [Prorocentrum cordatum]|uniref:50S ribosomal protein L30 n=1 Tax=Prorocentrum cordatum TaxID=2364126 RepID=A0ABN9SNK3_9DINO|nr:unnamed protein product [Polarella glacialis]